MARPRAIAAVCFAFVVLSFLVHCSSSPETLPPPPGTNADGPDARALARAAVIQGSCLDRNENASQVLDRLYRETYATGSLSERIQTADLNCLSTATSGCQSLRDCLGITIDDAPQLDCKSSCAGEVFERCDGRHRIRVDCARHGLSCHPDAGCIAAPAVSCELTVFRASCRDGRPTVCVNGVLQSGPRCTELGLVCMDSGYPGCHGPFGSSGRTTDSALIVPYGGVACTGSDLLAQVNSGTVNVDCGGVGHGFTCQSMPSGSYDWHFCGQGTECNPIYPPPAPLCDGTSLVLCNAGKLERVDCTALGFTGCDATRGACMPNPW
ncbi:hypothetical protein LZC95_00545 [Pendulispora brunnea]|uniref:Uncharacterized protein n=1 Tax=Pendulispora brunnea TaxID=2905690 RepID=A0ABZ2K9G0_9BACT